MALNGGVNMASGVEKHRTTNEKLAIGKQARIATAKKITV